MDRHLKDPVAYNRDYQNFIQNLQKFHGSRGTGFKRVPFFGGKELDLFLLYKTVTSLGGFVKVTEEKKWREAAKCFNLPASCTNAAFSLRQYYLRYLASYERFHFFGEDVDDAVAEMRKTTIAGSMQNSGVNFGTFSSNFQLADAPVQIKPGPLGEPRVNNFDRLIFSLKSGLPNEVDFALNICTLLSNVTNSIFNLAKAPSIVDLLLAHVGIFTNGSSSMRELYKEWYQESDRDFVKFWSDSIDDEVLKEIYDSCCGMVNGSSPETKYCSTKSSLFSRNTNVINSVEANRALQVCVILHNFSYEGLNCLYIAGHEAAKRFLFLCAGTHLSSLRKVALDTLDNLADRMTLPIVQDIETQTYLRVLHSFLFSKDRARKVRAISIIAKLAAHEENEDVLSEGISDDIYDELIQCLTIPDIQLILNALDALYYLSDLGETTATAIVTVYRSIDILVCLVRVHAESYGNRAIAGFRIVENKNSIHAQKHAASQQSQRAMSHHMNRNTAMSANPQLAMHSNHVRNSPKIPPHQAVMGRHEQSKSEETEEVEPEIFAARWISAFYELAPGCDIRRSKVFTDYTESCKELGRKGVLNVQSFFKILGLVIPAQYWKQSDADKDDLVISGIRQRAQPLFVRNKNIKTAARVPDLSQSGLEQTHPARPMPISTPNLQSQQLKIPNNNTSSSLSSVQASAPLVLPQGNAQQGQVRMPHPVMVQFQLQGPRQSPLVSVSASDNSKLPSKQADLAQTMPLQLLQKHVDSQGNEQAAAPQNTTASQASSKEPSKQILYPVAASGANQQVTSNQKFIPIQLVQSQFLQQVQVPGQTQTVIQPAQPAVIQSQAPGIVTTVLNGPVQLSGNASTPQNIAIDPKLTATPKPSTAKEKHERKKAIKAARDIINADIRASNQDPVTQCQNLTDKIQKEMQQNFLQFHVHQQSIQAIQTQLQQVVLQNQQSKLPQNVMDDIQTRVRNHHAQMQMHYQKLQQLQLLLQQVQIRLSQEQKSASAETASLSDAQKGKGNSTLQREFTSPRILKKPVASNTSNDTSKTTILSNTSAVTPFDINAQNKAQALTSIQANPESNSSVASSAILFPSAASVGLVNTIAVTNGTVINSNPKQQITEAGVLSQQQVLSSSIMVNANPSASLPLPSTVTSNISTPQILPHSRSTALQSLPGQSSAPIPIFTSANPQNSSSQIQSGLIVPNKQFIQVPLLSNVQPVSANAKPVSLTQNTPILPRPQQANIAVSHPVVHSIQKTGIPGQTLLLTMPMSALPQQTIVLQDNSAGISRQPTAVKQTNQGIGLLPNNHVIVQSSSVSRTGPNSAKSQSMKAVEMPTVRELLSASSKDKQTSKPTANVILQGQSSLPADSKLTSIGKSAVSITPASSGVAVLANGPVPHPGMPTTSLPPSTTKQTLPSQALTGQVLPNGGINSDQQPVVVPSVKDENKLLKSVSQNCTQETTSTIVDTTNRTVSKEHKMNSSGVDSSRVLPGVGTLHNDKPSELVQPTTNRPMNELHVDSAAKRNNGFERFSSTKRPVEDDLESSSDIEIKRLKTSESMNDTDSLECTVNMNGNSEITNFGSTSCPMKNDGTRPRINGVFTDIRNEGSESKHDASINAVRASSLNTASTVGPSAMSDQSKTSNSEIADPSSSLTARQPNADTKENPAPLLDSSHSTEQTTDSKTQHTNRTNGPKSDLLDADRNTISKCETADESKTGNQTVSSDKSKSVELISRVNKSHEEIKQKQRIGKNCLWSSCSSCFSTDNDLLTHMVFTHAPSEGQQKSCKVPGCKPVKRPRGSMICHFKQVHCNPNSQGADDEQVTLPELLFPKVVDIEREDESPVTRSVRLTAALILRNIARNSSYGRQVISAHESKLVVAAMSTSEASNAIAACLEELTRKRRKPSDSHHDDEAS